MTIPVEQPVVEMRGVTKRFGALLVNDAIDFAVSSAEIVGLLGENGAGKSTLMNILFGFVRPDEANIRVGKRSLSGHASADAIAAGINMVHQHFMLVPTLTVTENIVLGREARYGPFLDMRAATESVRKLVAHYGLDIDPRAKVGDLSVGQAQRVEILRALYRDARILVLDEPTAVLAPSEVEQLFAILRGLAADGIGIVLIAHKLSEVLAVCDRLVVLRRGRKVGERLVAETTAAELTRMMIGEDAPAGSPTPKNEEVLRREPVLVLEDVAADGPGGRIDRLSLSVSTSEIVAVVGVDGNGQATLESVVVGLTPLTAGHIAIAGRDVTKTNVAGRRQIGLGYVPQDRRRTGLLLDQSLLANLMLGRHRTPAFSSGGLLRGRTASDRLLEELDRFDVRYGSPTDPAGSLSGGNQQKLVLARAVADGPSVLLASQIGRGLDVGAVAAVYRKLRELRRAGTGILLISFDLDEAVELADRICVICDGRLVLEVPAAAANRAAIGRAMTGAVH